MSLLPDPIRPYLALIRVGLYVAVAGTLFIGGCQHGKSSQEAKTAEVRGQFDAYKAKMVALTQQVAESAERARQEYESKSAEAARNYADGRKSAEEHQTTLVADLRAGNVRLRSEWAACMSAPGKGQAGSAVAGNDAIAPVSPDAVARVIRVGEDADNQVAWLQAELMATRKLADSCGAVQ
ncbi:hypothetical protein [Xanthomonas sp. LMG 12461]|uniref:hypothetical protein n=1 Tax=Xanthomonas sp. LMG 12461 TaxID=2014543 RepID=UPI0012658150|nr:hypothetical protein [Xanthomonas sp. LMG 12461]KAB7765390.1 hypothetical protein CEK68_11895 [Xanthomonas sp. LMG 12461]